MHRKKKKSIKSLQNKALSIWKDIAYTKYGKQCMVKVKFPLHTNIPHTKVIQVDHIITRSCKRLILDTRNGLPVCSTCNLWKHLQKHSVQDLILKIAEDQLIKGLVDGLADMQRIERTLGGFPDWSKRWWLEGRIKGLESELEELKGTVIYVETGGY